MVNSDKPGGADLLAAAVALWRPRQCQQQEQRQQIEEEEKKKKKGAVETKKRLRRRGGGGEGTNSRRIAACQSLSRSSGGSFFTPLFSAEPLLRLS